MCKTCHNTVQYVIQHFMSYIDIIYELVVTDLVDVCGARRSCRWGTQPVVINFILIYIVHIWHIALICTMSYNIALNGGVYFKLFAVPESHVLKQPEETLNNAAFIPATGIRCHRGHISGQLSEWIEFRLTDIRNTSNFLYFYVCKMLFSCQETHNRFIMVSHGMSFLDPLSMQTSYF